MFGEEKLIYFKECFVNEKSTYFCLNQKQISIILYFSSTALLKKIADMPGFHRCKLAALSRVLHDCGRYKLSPKSLISWFGMHSVSSSPLNVCSQRYSTLFHKHLELAVEMLLQKEVILFKIRLPSG